MMKMFVETNEFDVFCLGFKFTHEKNAMTEIKLSYYFVQSFNFFSVMKSIVKI